MKSAFIQTVTAEEACSRISIVTLANKQQKQQMLLREMTGTEAYLTWKFLISLQLP